MRSDVEAVQISSISCHETEPLVPSHPTLLGVSRTPTSPTPPARRFHRPHLQIKTSFDDETCQICQIPKENDTQQIGYDGCNGCNGANGKGKDRITDEKTPHLLTPKAKSPDPSRSASSKKTKLPGLVEKDLKDPDSRSPPLRRSSVFDEKDTKDRKDSRDLRDRTTFPVCSLGSVCSVRVESAMTRPSQRTISRPKLSSRRHSTRD